MQFVDKPEFELHVIPAIEMKDGAHALWQTFYAIVEKEAKSDSPFFVFCEDDHVFTENYTFDYLQSQIEAADRMNADLLSGGMSWLLHPIQVTEKLFWVATFNGMQFTVVFRRFYQRILAAKTTQGYVTDFRLSALSHRKFVMYPYISVQKEFDYSDVTTGNDRPCGPTRLLGLAHSSGNMPSHEVMQLRIPSVCYFRPLRKEFQLHGFV